ncbi:MAG: ABC transporter permease [Clostridia bacterium]
MTMEMNKKGFSALWGKLKGVDYLPLIGAYILMCVFFSLTSKFFLSFNNFMNIALYATIIGLLSLTTTLVLAAGRIDFSAGAVMALGSCVMGVMLKAGYNIWLAIAACLVICVLTGVYNGFMIAYIGLSPFIATLAGMQMFRGFAYLLTNARSITVSSDVLKFISRYYTLGVPNAVWLLLVMIVLFTWITRCTTFGRRIMVIGGNPKVAFLSGINVKGQTMLLFMLHGLIVGLATIIYTGQLGAALPSAAMNLNFQTISACVLGGISLSGGKGSIVGGIVGAMLLGTLNNGMIMLDINSYWQDVIIGFVLIFAVTLDIVKNRKKGGAY